MAVIPEMAVLFDHVTKRFSGHTAVEDLCFRVPRGAVYGLLGPNGAGKTTSIRMLMAILWPDTGRIRVLGQGPAVGGLRSIGYLPEERGLYKGMKVIDNLLFFGGLRGLAAADVRSRTGRWLDRLGMTADADRKLQELSKGNQQKIQFIATVLHDPELLVLDEPFTGLDPVNQDLMRRTILELSEAGTTIILSTHLMDEVERLCTHLALVDAGRALVEGRVEDVKRRYGADTIRLDIAGNPEAVEALPEVREVRRIGRTLELRLGDGEDPSAFLARAAALVPVRRFEVLGPSIHGIFVNLVGGARAADAVGAGGAAPSGTAAPAGPTAPGSAAAPTGARR